MAVPPARSPWLLFSKLLSLFLLLGCFFFPSSSSSSSSSASTATNAGRRPSSKKRRLITSNFAVPSSRFKPHKAISSSWALIRRTLTKMPSKISAIHSHSTPTTPTLTSSARSSHRSLVFMSLQQQEPLVGSLVESPSTSPTLLDSGITSNIHATSSFLPLRNDIFPCTACGEIFPSPHLLDQHRSVKHAVSELVGDDSGQNIVRIIFKTGWTTDRESQSPKIHRILKIHNSAMTLARFEEYRELVKSRAANSGAAVDTSRSERCMADGNELLRFHCSTFTCELGLDGGSTTCNQDYCGVCGIIRLGFSPKLDGISTLSTSWRAHVAIPEETVEEFGFMNVRRAMLICRVIAGRVRSEPEDEAVDGKEGCRAFDSVVVREGGSGRLDEEELAVFNPRAVLPCFVIVYTV
ncbi:hypothetical protein SAY87_013551 [Trapa incisa]|uniref:C2H2-type domain-containing protein n=1 Tax=Trapa incisa TaxID=236973 RepID=A0AAN7K8W3_9MYRT|nr:hypothetical protein SAY87_013551 [Trapa incisa]